MVTFPFICELTNLPIRNYATCRSDFDGDTPEFDRSSGSREIRKVSDAVVVLYKIVRAANGFFFAGELELAYLVLVDALKLFKKLDNDKAVAVASNNLGNTMLAMISEMSEMGLHRHCGLSKKEIIARAMGHFQRSIELGEKAYDEFYNAEGWTHKCLDFMQHLSNRYFNRALFLLSIKDSHDNPEEVEELGLRDLEIARDMDCEIVEYGEDVGFNRDNRAHKLFQVNLIRARGHNMLLEMGYPDRIMSEKGYPDNWYLSENLDECFKLLQLENSRGGPSELFADINRLGRLQEIETELMKYKLLVGDVEMAARIAIRILHEDALGFAESLMLAMEVLLSYSRSNMMDTDNATKLKIRLELNRYITELQQDLEDLDDATKESTLESFSEEVSTRMSKRRESELTSSLKRSQVTSMMKKRISHFVTMEDF